MYCMRRYCFNMFDFIYFKLPVVQETVDISDLITANFLKELISLRDGRLTLSNGVCFDTNDLTEMIEHVSTF